MGFSSLLERLGFVRLRDYGLLLTPDRRIVTTRPILDDGYGAVVVGYANGDLAAIELGRTGAAKPQPIPEPPPIPLRPMPELPVCEALPWAPASQAHKLVEKPIDTKVETMFQPTVVDEPELEDDDWEWQIAAARARAEAEPIVAPRTTKPTPTPHVVKRVEVVRTTVSRTIIPVPALPVANEASEVTRQLPAPRRLAYGVR